MVHFFFQFREQVGVFVDQLEVGLQFLDSEAQLGVHDQETVQDLLVFLQAGRFLGLAPDGGIGQLGVDFLYLVSLFGYFKETPGDRRLSASVLRKGF
jgi:hypothetical protein